MQFKEWFLNEDTQLQRQFKTDGTELPLGNYGRFKTTYIYKNGTPNRFEEAAKILPGPAMEANRRLDYLGFPNVAANTIIADGYTNDNWIVGGGQRSAFGYANRKKHGQVISLDRFYYDPVETFVHEYAHMYWHNSMSKMAKDLFINKHKELVGQLKQEDMFNDDMLKTKLEEYMTRPAFVAGLLHSIQQRFAHFDNVKDIEDEIIKPQNQEIIAEVVDKYVFTMLMHDELPDKEGNRLGLSPVPNMFSHEVWSSLPGKEVAENLAKTIRSYAAINQHQGALDSHEIEKAIKNSLKLSMAKVGPEYVKYVIEKISYPDGKIARDALYKKFNLPSSYSAANYDELWAETVEQASKNLRSLNPELLKLLKDAIFLSR
jgi:hypothetical protein